jgi:ketosteroid isomerase-like protein
MRWRSAGILFAVVACIALTAIGIARGARVAPGDARQQVFRAEREFAATMARRDFEAFAVHLSREAVFMGPGGARRGKEAVAEAWRGYFDKPEAPFSWAPDAVEVLASGTLAYSSGPVRDAAGRQIGRFNSVWRLEGPGTWRVVFDRGCDCGR